MYTFWVDKWRFHMKEPIRFRQEYFSDCHWCLSFAHATPQLDPLDIQKVWAGPRSGMMMAKIDDAQISWKIDFSGPLRTSKLAKSLCSRKISAARDHRYDSWRPFILLENNILSDIRDVAWQRGVNYVYLLVDKWRCCMKEPIRVGHEYFSDCHWCDSFTHAQLQFDPYDIQKFELEQRLTWW